MLQLFDTVSSGFSSTIWSASSLSNIIGGRPLQDVNRKLSPYFAFSFQLIVLSMYTSSFESPWNSYPFLYIKDCNCRWFMGCCFVPFTKSVNVFFASRKFRLLKFDSPTDLPLKKRCMQLRWYLASSAWGHLPYWIFEDTSSDSGSVFPSQNVFNVSWSLHFCCCHVNPVDVTYLVCCYIRMFTWQLKIKFFFTNKTMCSVIVWTFTSCRFCGKLCCCNQSISKSFSLFGILLITWVFHPNSGPGWQIVQQIMDWILTCSWNTFQCFQSFLL